MSKIQVHSNLLSKNARKTAHLRQGGWLYLTTWEIAFCKSWSLSIPTLTRNFSECAHLSTTGINQQGGILAESTRIRFIDASF
jgi:hypothetical protein